MKRNDERQLLWIITATGIASVAAQLVIIREFLSLFSGNEFVIAITLFNWLVLGGIGTLIQRISAGVLPGSKTAVSFLSVLLCVTGMLEIYLIRFLFAFFFPLGVQTGFWETFLFNFAVSSPYALLVGYLLPFTLQVIKKSSPDFPSVKVYMADNIGDALGGALFSFVLVWFFTPALSLFLSALPLLLAAFFLLSDALGSKAISTAVPLLTVLITASGIYFETVTLHKKNAALCFYKETPYGRIEVHQYMGDYTLFRNGETLFDTQNIETAEKTVHLGLSQLENIDNILFVSASAGVFQEAQKYSPKLIEYAEIDPEVTHAMFKFSFLKRLKSVVTVHEDPRTYVNENKKKYSAILMALPDPDNYQLNRYFTHEFFLEVKRRLLDDGVFVFSIKGFDNYIEKKLLKKISSLFVTAGSCFNHVMVLPSSKVYFIMSQKEIYQNIPDLLAQKGINTSYIKNYFSGDISERRVKKLTDMIDPNAPMNRDFSPVIIKYALGHWFAKFNSSPFIFGGVAAILFFVYLLMLSSSETVLFLTGFTAMAMQILILFVFQIIFGYIYLKTGMVITLFLAGLLPGAFVGEKFFKYNTKKGLVWFDLSILFLVIFFSVLLFIMRFSLPQSFFFTFSFVFAFFCGAQFSISLRAGKDTSRHAAGLFAADLIGASAGLLVFSLVLMPVLGIFKSVVVLCLIKSFSLTRIVP